MVNNAIEQRPTPPNDWLYFDTIAGDESSRIFRLVVSRPASTPAWTECTTAQKEQWEREHPQPEPPEND